MSSSRSRDSHWVIIWLANRRTLWHQVIGSLWTDETNCSCCRSDERLKLQPDNRAVLLQTYRQIDTQTHRDREREREYACGDIQAAIKRRCLSLLVDSSAASSLTRYVQLQQRGDIQHTHTHTHTQSISLNVRRHDHVSRHENPLSTDWAVRTGRTGDLSGETSCNEVAHRLFHYVDDVDCLNWLTACYTTTADNSASWYIHSPNLAFHSDLDTGSFCIWDYAL